MKSDYSVDVGGSRLDVYLAERVAEQSRSQLQSLIRQGKVMVNGTAITKPAHELRSGDVVRVIDQGDEPLEQSLAPPDLDIIHEDSEFLVLNKPPGIVVHPGHGHGSGTLTDGVAAYAPEAAEVEREGLVHRLDKDTSGVILFAKNASAHERLQQLFKSREVIKTYLAILDGHPPSPRGRIEASIGRDPHDRQRYSVQDSSGKEAITEFKVREAYSKHSLIEAHPITGRTHQIRLHMRFIECPVVGDTVYGRKRPSLQVERQMLHAWKLKLPGREAFEAAIPQDFAAAIGMAKSA